MPVPKMFKVREETEVGIVYHANTNIFLDEQLGKFRFQFLAKY